MWTVGSGRGMFAGLANGRVREGGGMFDGKANKGGGTSGGLSIQ